MIDLEQGSPEWFAARLGNVTASRVCDVVARTKSGWGASRANYMAQLIAERLTGKSQESFQSAEMRWGNEVEPQARRHYTFLVDEPVAPVGYVRHPSIGDTGASPDSFVGHNGLLEIKCPNTATHIETLEGRAVPGKYATQMQWQMACTGRQWCDFVSFDPRMPVDMQMFMVRVGRDVGRIAELEREVIVFLAELRAKLDNLTRIYRPEPVQESVALMMAG